MNDVVDEIASKPNRARRERAAPPFPKSRLVPGDLVFADKTLRSSPHCSARLRKYVVVRTYTRMRTLTVISLLLIVGVMCAAGVCYIVTDLWSRAARQELVVFKEHANGNARNKVQIYPGSSPGSFIVPIQPPPTISPADREHIDALQFRYQSLFYRRGLAAWFFMRGALVFLGLACVYWLIKKHEMNQPEPTPRTPS
jgi:hypothetical protein